MYRSEQMVVLEEFALGYYYGRAFGNLPEDDYPDTMLFRQGFDAGVRDYCEYDLGEDNE
jgi:hypothetical protein